ncbi:hypothetical protein T440DRAFT_482790 [Plenodomus tracheiphilus IPT5]|uniref:Uncharacterized protein n=1 Tax=Plenodomus tracheiphilus IPT5 TaxID=1408161 RepID=A0A6A7ASL0_9PLEO|nr:hypothetical protein T440DRAFT_482790 [Plenodomus tracheiphilus IPT5]
MADATSSPAPRHAQLRKAPRFSTCLEAETIAVIATSRSLTKRRKEFRNTIYIQCIEIQAVERYDSTGRNVCHRLRSEFRPIFLSQTTIMINFDHFWLRWSALFPNTQENEVPMQHHGGFVLCPSIANEDDDSIYAEIARLLQHVALQPNIHIRFQPPDNFPTGLTHGLARLGNLFHHISTDQMFRDMVVDLDVCEVWTWHGRVDLVFAMTRAASKKWDKVILKWRKIFGTIRVGGHTLKLYARDPGWQESPRGSWISSHTHVWKRWAVTQTVV